MTKGGRSDKRYVIRLGEQRKVDTELRRRYSGKLESRRGIIATQSNCPLAPLCFSG